MKSWRPAAHLPDPLVGLVPVLAEPVGQRRELHPAVVRDRPAVLVEQVDGVHQLAVDVELELVVGAVSDAYRLRAPIALEVVERLLGQLAPPVDRVHDLERARHRIGVGDDPVAEPVGEGLRLVGEPQAKQGVERERRVPDPRVAVVPVAAAPDHLGEACRGRGHDRAGRAVGQELQGERRTVDHLAPAALVLRAREPAPPERDRLLVGRARLRLRVLARHVVGLDPLEDEGDRGARAHGELTVDAGLVARHGRRGLEREAEVRRAEHDTVLVLLDLVLVAAVVEARLHFDPEAHLAADSLDAADEPMAMDVLLRLRDRHEALDLPHALLGEEAGDEHVRIGEVELLRRPVLRHRGDAVVAALVLVEDRGEDARRIERRAAVPVDVSVGAGQRDRVQVAHDPVLGDRQVSGHALFSAQADTARQVGSSAAVRDERQSGHQNRSREGREADCKEANAHTKPKERPKPAAGLPPKGGFVHEWAGSILISWGLVRGFDIHSSRT